MRSSQIEEEIAPRAKWLFAPADQIEARLVQARVQVDKLTPSFLARAFRGRRVLQDPTDEAASSLLEKIKLGRIT